MIQKIGVIILAIFFFLGISFFVRTSFVHATNSGSAVVIVEIVCGNECDDNESDIGEKSLLVPVVTANQAAIAPKDIIPPVFLKQIDVDVSVRRVDSSRIQVLAKTNEKTRYVLKVGYTSDYELTQEIGESYEEEHVFLLEDVFDTFTYYILLEVYDLAGNKTEYTYVLHPEQGEVVTVETLSKIVDETRHDVERVPSARYDEPGRNTDFVTVSVVSSSPSRSDVTLLPPPTVIVVPLITLTSTFDSVWKESDSTSDSTVSTGFGVPIGEPSWFLRIVHPPVFTPLTIIAHLMYVFIQFFIQLF